MPHHPAPILVSFHEMIPINKPRYFDQTMAHVMVSHDDVIKLVHIMISLIGDINQANEQYDALYHHLLTQIASLASVICPSYAPSPGRYIGGIS